MDTELRNIYYTPKESASFSHAKALKARLKDKSHLSVNVIQNWLNNEDTYGIHRPTRRRFRRRKIVVSGIDDQWQADLADLKGLSRYNKGFRYLLGCIDVFSKYAFVLPLKTKSAQTVLKALKKLLKGHRKPKRLQTDMGSEFRNKSVQKYLKEMGIHFFYTENQDIKASIIERFWRTLKGRMYRYFTFKQTKKYIDVIDDLVHSYNNTYHRSIRMPPAHVNKENEEQVWQTLYGSDTLPTKKPKFKVGDLVRISKYKGAFDKGYLPNWSREIFIIKSVKDTQPVTYLLEDQNKEEMKGTFYEDEVQLVRVMPDTFRVERILGRRVRDGRKQVLIKWLDYPHSFNSWEDEGNVVI